MTTTQSPPSTNGTGPDNWIPGYDEGKPDLSKVLDLFRTSRQYFSRFRSQCETSEMYYFNENIVPHVEGFDIIRPSTAKAIIDTATDHVDVNNLAIDVIPPSARARARAERLKKFYIGTWANLKTPVKRTAVGHSFLYGIGFMKVLFKSEEWPDAPQMDDYSNENDFKEALDIWMEKRNISFPIDVRNVNPKNLIWDDSRVVMKWAIEYYEREAGVIRRRYPEWTSAKDSAQMVNWLEYWDDEWAGYIADNQWVWGPYRHGYNFLPYVPILPADSLDWDIGPLHRRYRGLITPITSLLDAEARAVSQQEAIVRQYAWPTLDFQGPIGPAETARTDYELLGKNLLPQGVTVMRSQGGAIPSDIMTHLSMVGNYIEQDTFPNVVRGVRPKGVSSGFAISVLSGMGRLKFQGIADGVSRAIEICNSNFAKLVEHKIKGKITVHARSEVHNFDQAITPQDIRGFVENIVTLKAEAPEEREREAILAQNLHGAGIISLAEAQRRAGIMNPLEMQNEMAAERILQSQEFLAAQIQAAAERFGLLGQLAQVADQPMGGGLNTGQFQEGLSQLQRPGEAGIQRQRLETNQRRDTNMGGIDALGSIISGAAGGSAAMPSGGRAG